MAPFAATAFGGVLAVIASSSECAKSDRFRPRLCKNFRAFSHEPVSFAFAGLRLFKAKKIAKNITLLDRLQNLAEFLHGLDPELPLRTGPANARKARKRSWPKAQGLIEAPVLIQLCMGIRWGGPDDLNTLMAIVNNVPAGWTFSAFSIGRNALAYPAAAVLAGGNVRVRLEDNLYVGKGLVERALARVQPSSADPKPSQERPKAESASSR